MCHYRRLHNPKLQVLHSFFSFFWMFFVVTLILKVNCAMVGANPLVTYLSKVTWMQMKKEKQTFTERCYYSLIVFKEADWLWQMLNIYPQAVKTTNPKWSVKPFQILQTIFIVLHDFLIYLPIQHFIFFELSALYK